MRERMAVVDDLITFLTARLDDEEERARAGVAWLDPATAPREFDRAAQRARAAAVQGLGGLLPDRVLREVEGVRRLIVRYQNAASAVANRSELNRSLLRERHNQDSGYAEACADALRDAAFARYADHAEYRQEWMLDG